MTISCREVNIRFKNANMHQQRLQYTDYSGSSFMMVNLDNLYVTVTYQYKAHDGSLKALKVILFNREEVVEVECENNLTVS